jgi:hypothetical protein
MIGCHFQCDAQKSLINRSRYAPFHGQPDNFAIQKFRFDGALIANQTLPGRA